MSAPVQAASYAAVFRLPHARRTFGAALFGRLGYGVVSLSLVLSLTSATGSLSRGGLLATLFATVSVLLGPARAALVDRWGARRGLTTLALPFATTLFVLAAAVREPGAPLWAFAGLSGAAGALCPPLGPTMRALWDALTPDEALLQRAFSVDTVAEELIFLSGPLLVVAVHPVNGLVLSGALIGCGTLAMVTSPAARLLPPRHKSTASAAERLRLFGEKGGGVRRAAYAAAGIGCCLGCVELFVIAFADRHHHPSAVGWILAAQSAGSALGGLLYGRISWRLPAAARLPGLLLVLAALVSVTAAAPVLTVFGLCVAAAGTLTAPILSTAYLAAAGAAPDGATTRATTWVNSAVNAGSSAGGALAALLVAGVPLTLCFLLAAVPPLLAAVAIGWARRTKGGAEGPVLAKEGGGV
ncbi:MFS transporter [Streptomyces sp. NPDC008139]|uniref:MFS transporter n=1 Tax=Streptomyces sp. NPDC008139 TaxID=3364814 RepID=UPI0036EE9D08